MIRIKLTSAAECAGIKCADTRACFRPVGLASAKKKWIAKHDLFVGGGRAFVLVDTAKEVFFMDAVTGSLYQFGRCRSSDRLSIPGLRRDKKKAAEILMNTTGPKEGTFGAGG